MTHVYLYIQHSAMLGKVKHAYYHRIPSGPSQMLNRPNYSCSMVPSTIKGNQWGWIIVIRDAITTLSLDYH